MCPSVRRRDEETCGAGNADATPPIFIVPSIRQTANIKKPMMMRITLHHCPARDRVAEPRAMARVRPRDSEARGLMPVESTCRDEVTRHPAVSPRGGNGTWSLRASLRRPGKGQPERSVGATAGCVHEAKGYNTGDDGWLSEHLLGDLDAAPRASVQL